MTLTENDADVRATEWRREAGGAKAKASAQMQGVSFGCVRSGKEGATYNSPNAGMHIITRGVSNEQQRVCKTPAQRRSTIAATDLMAMAAIVLSGASVLYALVESN